MRDSTFGDTVFVARAIIIRAPEKPQRYCNRASPGGPAFIQGIYMDRNQELKIAFFSKELPSDRPNGVSCQVHYLAEALQMRGHGITVFSFSPKPPDARYQHVALRYRSRYKLLQRFEPAVRFARLRTFPFDVLHYHGDDYLCPGDVRRVRTLYGSALDESLHAYSLSRMMRQLLFYGFEWWSVIRKGTMVGISRTTCRSLPVVKTVIPCGIPLSTFRPGPGKSKHPRILFVGDLDSRKRGRLVLKVFEEEILPRIPEARLVVVGPQPCEGVGVEYAGVVPRDRLIEEYRAAWVLWSAAVYEGFGVPLIEAMACCTPVLSCRNAGALEIIQHNYNGILTDENSMGNSLCRLLRSPDTRERIGNNGLRYVEKRFDMNRIAKYYETLYRSLSGVVME